MKEHKTTLAVMILLGVAACILIFLRLDAANSGERLEPLKVTVLKIGKADAIVAQNGDQTVVIDAGEEEDGAEIVTFLTRQGISRVDTLIITHFDKDHVGGADTLVEAMEIGQILLPDYEGNHTEYLDFMKALRQQGIEPLRLTGSMEFKLGEADVRVEPPESFEIPDNVLEYDNNLSLVTTITHGNNRLLFAGDAEKQRIREWISGGTAEACDFVKMPHHGVYETALQELLETVSPEYAVICSSNKHPSDTKTLELLKKYGVRTFETKNGDVTVTSDGNKLEVVQ